MKKDKTSSTKPRHELRVSRKFYADLCERIASTCQMTANPSKCLERCLAVIDSYINTGKHPSPSSAKEIQLIFNLLRPEIDRAITRSENARRRAEMKKSAAVDPKQSKPTEQPGHMKEAEISTSLAGDEVPETIFLNPDDMIDNAIAKILDKHRVDGTCEATDHITDEEIEDAIIETMSLPRRERRLIKLRRARRRSKSKRK